MSNKIETFNIESLFKSEDLYSIPIYQRNYAWESKEIEQLILDVVDYAKSHNDKNYYIGTLVVYEDDKNNWSTIDGQQRLTTLNILTSVLKNEFKALINLSWFDSLNLGFASREKSILSLRACFNGKFENELVYESNIREAYSICKNILSKLESTQGISVSNFAEYLYKYVTILRVPLPKGIDLNHYFEIMNSRGEQLEKHEILKATLMDAFNDEDKSTRELYHFCFNLIWEACSNMERYVQSGFIPEQRHLIFGKDNWNKLVVFSFEELVQKIKNTVKIDIENKSLSIEDILIDNNIKLKEDEDSENPDRFNSVINFQNFLLHVLRVQIKSDKILLDDKKLLDVFKIEIAKNKKEFAKEFIFNLLKCKFLFDKYIIKREFTAGTDRWALKCFKHYSHGKVQNGIQYKNTFGEEDNENEYSDNRKVLMLLAMFHVSIPSMAYKYWLHASLNFLFYQNDISSSHYISYLEHIAKSFVYDRHIAKDPLEYPQMIFENQNPIIRKSENIDWNKLRYNEIDNNLIFNYVDYLLWSTAKRSDTKFTKFDFKFRSSVEHFYPQHPIGNSPTIEEKYLHEFGNLCLISHSDNSKLSNYLPDAKETHYRQKPDIDSLKQYVMMQDYDLKTWGVEAIIEHNAEMIELFEKNKDSDFQKNKEISKAVKWFLEKKEFDKRLLARTLLCFADYPKEVGANKYQLFSFESARKHKAFSLFEEYVEKNNPSSLTNIIDEMLKTEQLANSYRYLFVKYPEIIEYCKAGNFNWFEGKNDNLIYLLRSEKRTENTSKELYVFLLGLYIKNKFYNKIYQHYSKLSINFNVKNNNESLENDDCSFQLNVWNQNGYSLNHNIVLKIQNQVNIDLMRDLNWKYNENDKVYYINDTPELVIFTENIAVNFDNCCETLNKILKIDLITNE
jgi:hypothetical protein